MGLRSLDRFDSRCMDDLSSLRRNLWQAVALFYAVGCASSVTLYSLTGEFQSASIAPQEDGGKGGLSVRSTILFLFVQLALVSLCFGTALCLKGLLVEVVLDPRCGGKPVEVWNALYHIESRVLDGSYSTSTSSAGVGRSVYRSTTAESHPAPEDSMVVLNSQDIRPWDDSQRAVYGSVPFPSRVRHSEPYPRWCYHAGGSLLWTMASQTPRLMVAVDSWTLVVVELVLLTVGVSIFAIQAGTESERLVRNLLMGWPLVVPVATAAPLRGGPDCNREDDTSS